MAQFIITWKIALHSLVAMSISFDSNEDVNSNSSLPTSEGTFTQLLILNLASKRYKSISFFKIDFDVC